MELVRPDRTGERTSTITFVRIQALRNGQTPAEKRRKGDSAKHDAHVKLMPKEDSKVRQKQNSRKRQFRGLLNESLCTINETNTQDRKKTKDDIKELNFLYVNVYV